MFAFDEDTKRILESSGWFETRQVRTNHWIDRLTNEGFQSFPSAFNVLENLGGLDIIPTPDPKRVFFPDPFFIDPARCGFGEFELVDFWQREFGLILFPLGEVLHLDILLISPNGTLFAAPLSGWKRFRDPRSQFLLIGESVETALALLTLARCHPIPYILSY